MQVGSCSSNGECQTNWCLGGVCCNDKIFLGAGGDTGCAACWSETDGDCRTCTENHYRSGYSCYGAQWSLH